MAKVSVVVPVYNVEQFLAHSLDSLRRQTCADIEIICVNDGSCDRSRDILSSAQLVDDRIRTIDQPNSGVSAARNAGIAAATGQVIMFVDADDMLEPKACATVLEAFTRYNPDIVTFGASVFPSTSSTQWFDRVLSPRDITYKQYNPALLFKESSYPFIWHTAVSRNFLHRTGIRFDDSVKFGEDVLFYFEAYPLSRCAVLLSERLYTYRTHRSGSLMRTREDDVILKLREHQIVTRRILSHWEQQGWLQQSAPLIAEWTIDYLVLDLDGRPDWVRARIAPGIHCLFMDFFSDPAIRRLLPMAHQMIIKQVCSPLYSGSIDLIRILAFQNQIRGSAGVVELIARLIRDSRPLGFIKEALRRILPPPAAHVRDTFTTVQEITDDGIRRSLATHLLRLEANSRSRSQAS